MPETLIRGLTLYMSGGTKGAKRSLGRPLDEGVRRQVSGWTDRENDHASASSAIDAKWRALGSAEPAEMCRLDLFGRLDSGMVLVPKTGSESVSRSN